MNRSAFLNEVDGLEENEGMYIIASTNHFDRLDGALKNRPSRFDRKFTFDDPNLAERGQYAKYWQNKLASRDLGFTDAVAQDWAASTDGFSFAYCKESFISTLLFLAAHEGESSFAEVLQDQVASLRKELHADPDVRTLPAWDFGASPRGFAVPEVDMVETPLDRAQMVFARA
jgi:transitional endoplasmic reticulum ATPase